MFKLRPLEWIVLGVVVVGGIMVWKNNQAGPPQPVNRQAGASGAQGPLPGAGPGVFAPRTPFGNP
jgi:hypothetical protein